MTDQRALSLRRSLSAPLLQRDWEPPGHGMKAHTALSLRALGWEPIGRGLSALYIPFPTPISICQEFDNAYNVW
jgi:hypothetical protein